MTPDLPPRPDPTPSRLVHRRLRTVIRDGEPVWQLRCPGCDQWGDIDDDQLHGRVSVEHGPGDDDKGFAASTGCGYHDTHDWFSEGIGA